MKSKFFIAGIPAMALTLGLVLLVMPCQTALGQTNSKQWRAVKDSTLSDDASDSYGISAIAYGGGTFVAVGSWYNHVSGPGKIAYSTDGITWTRVADNKLGYTEAVAYGAGKFVAGGAGGISYSADGVTWTRVSGAIFSAGGSGGVPASVTGIYYAGGKFLAKGGYQGPNRSWWRDKMSYSTDGVTWTAIEDSTILSYEVRDIAYGGGKFVAVGGYPDRDGKWKGKMAYSADGVTWTRVADPKIGSLPIESIAYGGGKFVTGNGWRGLAYSTDGVTWTEVWKDTDKDSLFERNIRVIIYGADTFIAGGDGDRTAYSKNGIKWTALGTILGGGPTAIAYGGGMFVAGGKGGKMVYWKKK